MKPSEISQALTICITAKQPVVVWGAPGIGKSQVAQQTAASLGRKVIDVRASLLDPVDLRGIPSVATGRTCLGGAVLPAEPV
jgi:MoxR-like ATPase